MKLKDNTFSEDESIHYVGYSSQPYVRIHCLNEDRYVLNESEMDKVYYCEDVTGKGKILYTFDFDKVTCNSCLMAAKDIV